MLSIKLDQPFRLAFGELQTLPRVIYDIKLANGLRGYGEAGIDFPFSDYDMYDVFHALRTLKIEGRDIRARGQMLEEQSAPNCNALLTFPAALTAFNMALDDAYGKLMGESALEIYGKSREAGRAMRSISVSNSSELRRSLSEALLDKYLPKIKVGMSHQEDIRIIMELDNHNISYALDFNAAYGIDEATAILGSALKNNGGLSNALYIEQPTKKSEGIGALEEISKLLRNAGRKGLIVADESFTNQDEAVRCAVAEIALNFKLQKIGGLQEAKKIERALENLNLKIESMIGGTFPTAIGRTYDQLAACVLQSATLYSDGLLPSTDYFPHERHLIHEDFRRKNGLVYPIIGPGLGFTPNEIKIAPFVIEDPEKDYRMIRTSGTGKHISIKLNEDRSYGEVYLEKTGRNPMWNL